MENVVKRGYVPSDRNEFCTEKLELLRRAQEEILFLIERGYPIKSASTFVGNHYMLSERQRLAIVRATTQREIIRNRSNKLVQGSLEGKTVNIDGLNQIITLEVALSDSTLIRCMDGTIRDLAGLRGTYRLIDKTDIAIKLIGDKLDEHKIQKANIYLDAPVSNTGRLKQRIHEIMSACTFQVSVMLVDNADIILEKKDCVATSDAIILNKCITWINLVNEILKEQLPQFKFIDLSNI